MNRTTMQSVLLRMMGQAKLMLIMVFNILHGTSKRNKLGNAKIIFYILGGFVLLERYGFIEIKSNFSN